MLMQMPKREIGKEWLVESIGSSRVRHSCEIQQVKENDQPKTKTRRATMMLKMEMERIQVLVHHSKRNAKKASVMGVTHQVERIVHEHMRRKVSPSSGVQM